VTCPKGCGWEGPPKEFLHHSCGDTGEKGENNEKKQEIHSLTPHVLYDDLGIDPDAKIKSIRLLVPPETQDFWEPVIEIVLVPKSHIITPHTLQDNLQIGGKIVAVRLLVEPEKQNFYEPVVEIVEAVEEEE